jgi:hypothetical protein
MQLARSGIKAATVANLGVRRALEALSPPVIKEEDIAQGRMYREVERIEPGFIRRELDALVARHEEPSRERLHRAITNRIDAGEPRR